ncbi:MAG TPA: hypothetical protein VLG38_03215 [Gammaproteobacteria bacterium]|nr:hypothetical protein [Gammaproteobacteria bacterium]
MIKALVKAVILLLVTTVACAKPYNVEVILTKVVAQKPVSADGDRIYVDIAAYPASGSPQILREPMFPMHWLTKELPQIKNVKLWEGTIKDEDSVLLVFSLIDQVLPTLDDALLGSARVEISNRNKQLQTKWDQPKYADQPRVDQIDGKPSYIMYGESAQYAVDFAVKINP